MSNVTTIKLNRVSRTDLTLKSDNTTILRGAASPAQVTKASVGMPGPAGPNAIVNTDGYTGVTLYVGATDPALTHTLSNGDVWLVI